MDECGEKNTISLSWGRREIRISGEGATLYVNGVPHDMTMMLETIRKHSINSPFHSKNVILLL